MQARILIVEDEEKIARFLELELQHEGYEVQKAADGRTGLELAESGEFELMVLDVMRPQLNGLEVLRRLRLNRIELLLEPSPGIVVGRASGSDGRTLLLATKSGGFGKPEALLELYRYFTARKQAGLKGEVV